MANLSEKYRQFRAYHKYSYPGLFIAISSAKALLQIGVVFAVAWYALSLMTGGQHAGGRALAQDSNAADKSLQLTGFTGAPAQVEIPAIATSEALGQTSERVSSPVANPGVYNVEWLLKHEAGSYVVQLASSTDKPDLYQKAFELSDSHPVVVYPFKRTRSNRMMYGYAIGMYDSFNEAQADVKQLSENAVAEGVWIRSVGEIQKQVLSVR